MQPISAALAAINLPPRDPNAFLTSRSILVLWAESCSNCSMTSPLSPAGISSLSALDHIKARSQANLCIIRDAHSIASSQISWCRVAISLRAMDVVANRFMALPSRMKILMSNMISLFSFPWPTVAKIPTLPSSSSPLSFAAGSTTSTLSLAKSSRALRSSRKSRRRVLPRAPL